MAVVDAPAKVNLLLRVLGREADGYHSIETLFQTLEWGDRVWVVRTRSDELELDVEGPDPAPSGRNLALGAAETFLQVTGGSGGVRIRLEKRVPPGAGLGGGSSDAAAVLRGLAALTETPPGVDVLLGLARELGADVPFFLAPSPLCLGWGRGDRLFPLDPLPTAEILLVLPDLHVSTAEAYRALDAAEEAETADAADPSDPADPEGAEGGFDVEGAGGAGGVRDAGDGRTGREAGTEARGSPVRRGAALLSRPGSKGWEGVAAQAENDFERVVFREHPELGSTRDRLRELGARPALLSGSGSAVFGVFPSGGAGAAATALAPELPEGWSTRVTRTRSSSVRVVVESPSDG